MLLAIDVGNSFILLGAFEEEKLLYHFRLPTEKRKGAEEYGVRIRDLLTSAKVYPKRIDGLILSSVVPDLERTFIKLSQDLFKIDPVLVSSKLRIGLVLRFDNPTEVGADRIANAVAAHNLYKRNVIIVDFGTATTICVVTKEGEYLGGIIAPGIEISAQALWERASLLPKIRLKMPKEVMGKNTISSMQSGIIYGHLEMVDGMVRRVREEFSQDSLVVATGGWADLLGSISRMVDEVNPNLTLEGLRILYQMNKK